jgi:hypothetical protein
LSFPARSASSIIFTAMRSLIELPGLNVSSLTRMSASVTSRVMALMRTIGVCPMTSRMLLAIFFAGAMATRYLYHRSMGQGAHGTRPWSSYNFARRPGVFRLV